MYMTLKKLFKLLGRRIPTQAEVLGNLEVINTDDIPASELADYFGSLQFQNDVNYMLLDLEDWENHMCYKFQIAALYSSNTKRIVFQIDPLGFDSDCIETEQ